MFFKKKTRDLVTSESFIKFLNENSEMQESVREVLCDENLSSHFKSNLEYWFDKIIKPILGTLTVRSEVAFNMYIPTYEEFMRELMVGIWEVQSKDFRVKNCYRFLTTEVYDLASPEMLVLMITEIISHYGYKVTWECQNRTLMFHISMP